MREPTYEMLGYIDRRQLNGREEALGWGFLPQGFTGFGPSSPPRVALRPPPPSGHPTQSQAQVEQAMRDLAAKTAAILQLAQLVQTLHARGMISDDAAQALFNVINGGGAQVAHATPMTRPGYASM